MSSILEQLAKPVLGPWQIRSGVARNELLRLTANYEAIEPREPLLPRSVVAGEPRKRVHSEPL